MTSDTPHRTHGRPPVDDAPALQAEVLEHDHRLDECTLFPQDAADDERLTRWIAAFEGSYVDAQDYR